MAVNLWPHRKTHKHTSTHNTHTQMIKRGWGPTLKKLLRFFSKEVVLGEFRGQVCSGIREQVRCLCVHDYNP